MNPFSVGRPIDDIVMMQEDRRVDRHHLRQAAVLGDLARVPPLVDDADEEEERAGRDAVVELLDDAAGDADRVQREHARASPSPCG